MTTKTKTTKEATETTTTSISLAEPAAPPMTNALHFARRFSSEAVLTGNSYDMRRLTWLTGNNDCFAANGKTPLESARGWFLDQPDEDEMFPEDYELLDAMEQLCEQGKARPCVVVHYDDKGQPNRKASWQFIPGVSLFVICQGMPSKREMLDDPACRWGVAYGWPRDRVDEKGKAIPSSLHFGAFVKELMDLGYFGAFTVKFSSYVTDRAIACLKAQEYVLHFAEQLRAQAGETAMLPYYAYALPVKCSVNTLTAGSEPGKSKQVYYPIPAIPRLSLRTLEGSVAYLDSCAISDEQAAVLEQNSRVEEMVKWSVEKSRQILMGKEVEANGDGDD